MRRLLPLLLGLLLSCRRDAGPDLLATGTWVDLSHDFSAETVYWPTAKPFALEVVSAQRTPAGFYYAANNFAAAEHGGTHLDAPVHFAEGKHAADQIPLNSLVGPAVVIDVVAQAEANRDYLVDVAALEGWEGAHGRIPSDVIVLIRTGWDSRWPDKERYLGTAKTGPEAVPALHFPGIDSAAAGWLAGRGVRAVGIDTPSIDFGQSTSYPTHRTLFEQNIPAFENVAHLDALPATGSFVIALPMKIRGGSGGPLRIVAIVPPGRSRR
jgi:kynurenine formamidase